MEKVLVFKFKNGINIECEERLIKLEEAILRIEGIQGRIDYTKRYCIRSDSFCIEFLQEDIESVSYKKEDKESHIDVSTLIKDICLHKNYSLEELSINLLKDLCELKLNEIRKESKK